MNQGHKTRSLTLNRVANSLRSRRLEVAGERENGLARGRHARGERLLRRLGSEMTDFCLNPLNRKIKIKFLICRPHLL